MEGNTNYWPGRLKEMLDVVRARMQREGISAAKSSVLAEAAVAEIAQLFGGRQLYLPQGAVMQRALRDARIYSEFTGDNVQELAKKHRQSVVNIYNIIKKQRELLKEK